MTENKPLPVKGYTGQPDWKVDMVNANKVLEERVLRVFDELAKLEPIDKRWLAIGRTHIEEGFMAVNRSIFKPQRINLESDK